jgi:hypothetical protein
MKDFSGQLVRDIRNERRLSAKQVQDIAEKQRGKHAMPWQTVLKVETGGTENPGAYFLGVMSDVLECSIEDFYEFKQTEIGGNHE